jgi:hypothetical protein
MHSLVPLKTWLSDGKLHTLIVCLQFLSKGVGVFVLWRNVIKACSRPPRVTISRFFPSSSEKCVHKPWVVLIPNFFSFAPQLSSYARLTARCPCGTWIWSALSLNTSCHKSSLTVSMKKSFRASRILLRVPKIGERHLKIIAMTTFWGSFRLMPSSLLQTLWIVLT